MDDNYFEKLLVQYDITKGESFCENVSGRMLMVLRILGFSLSYITIYISRPNRIYKFLRNLFKKEFVANNLFEQRLYDLYVRFKLNRQTKKVTSKPDYSYF